MEIKVTQPRLENGLPPPASRAVRGLVGELGIWTVGDCSMDSQKDARGRGFSQVPVKSVRQQGPWGWVGRWQVKGAPGVVDQRTSEPRSPWIWLQAVTLGAPEAPLGWRQISCVISETQDLTPVFPNVFRRLQLGNV